MRDVSLAVEPGEIVLIMGPSGSGKTTLLSMMGALLRPTSGTIHLDGVALSELSEGRLPAIRLRQFGFIFQDFNLLSALTIRENVALVAELAGLKRAVARQKATAILTDHEFGSFALVERARAVVEGLARRGPPVRSASGPRSGVLHEDLILLDRDGVFPEGSRRRP